MSVTSLASHLRTDREGEFRLTGAIRPAAGVPVVPRQGYRREIYHDREADLRIPVLAALVSAENLFDVFIDLLSLLGETVDVVLETSHEQDDGGHRDLVREGIDLPVLMSHLCDFEELLLNDGCTGIAVVAAGGPMEVQFDEHKSLIVYAHDLAPFERKLRRAGVRRREELRLLSEGEHIHHTEPDHFEQFEQLCLRVGVAEAAEQVSW